MSLLRRLTFRLTASLLMAYLGFLQEPHANAQSYQSSFAGQSFDRSKGPSTMHGGIQIEASTGAVDVNIPLGPGIGSRGLTFRPLLRGHIAPTMDSVSYLYCNTQGCRTTMTLVHR